MAVANAATPSLAILPMGEVFGLTARAVAALGSGVTDLGPAAVELLVRADGSTSLEAIRRAMDGTADGAFAAAFRTLWQRGHLCRVTVDGFGLLPAGPGGEAERWGRPGETFSIGLVWRGVQAPLHDGPPWAVVVEDDPMLAKFIQCFLEMEGFAVRHVADRAGIVEGFRTPQPPDLVLLDVTLPDMDGFDLLGRLRQHPRLREVPMLMLTGCATRAGVLRALADGANGYLTKPFDAEVLTRAIAAATRGSAEPVVASANPWTNADALPMRAERRLA